jgi:hypothetical protein
MGRSKTSRQDKKISFSNPFVKVVFQRIFSIGENLHTVYSPPRTGQFFSEPGTIPLPTDAAEQFIAKGYQYCVLHPNATSFRKGNSILRQNTTTE